MYNGYRNWIVYPHNRRWIGSNRTICTLFCVLLIVACFAWGGADLSCNAHHCNWNAHSLRMLWPSEWRRWITSTASISLKKYKRRFICSIQIVRATHRLWTLQLEWCTRTGLPLVKTCIHTTIWCSVDNRALAVSRELLTWSCFVTSIQLKLSLSGVQIMFYHSNYYFPGLHLCKIKLILSELLACGHHADL